MYTGTVMRLIYNRTDLFQDNCLVCVVCLATTHNGHKCETIDENYARQVHKINELVRNAKKSNDPEVVQGIRDCAGTQNAVTLEHRYSPI